MTDPSLFLPPITDTNGHTQIACRELPPVPTIPADPQVPVFCQRDGNTAYILIGIIDEILGYLRTNESRLWRCALVSKSWTPCHGKHIFDRVTFEYLHSGVRD
ncbi:hypothetical protein BDM02DRAFT_1523239 [Thelephora ganbajun]|uniref:Uncharacterized protein n=1 Tax=Thelephora ganbajun TaxID=370292 RepID=A0ACB6Z1E6_THEGA|nr:hypothetical protein BDM02DRAFT_1523239 [Thelephora ganbajun]